MDDIWPTIAFFSTEKTFLNLLTTSRHMSTLFTERDKLRFKLNRIKLELFQFYPRSWNHMPNIIYVCLRARTPPSMLALLAESGADIHHHNDTPLREASELNLPDTVRYLLEDGADVNAVHPDQRNHSTPVYLACRYNNPDVLKVLLEHGADVPHTVLGEASNRGYIKIVSLLLEHGADPDESDPFMSPLDHACETGHTDIVSLLLSHGADVRGSSNCTLQRAIEGGHTEMVRILLDYGYMPSHDDMEMLCASGMEDVDLRGPFTFHGDVDVEKGVATSVAGNSRKRKLSGVVDD